MADRYLRGIVRTNQPVVDRLWLRFTITDSSGSVGTSAGDTSFVTVARTSTGKYTFTFADQWVGLLWADAQILNATLSGVTAMVISQAVTGAGGTVVVQFVGPTNSSTTTAIATDPPNGSTIYAVFDMLNSGA